MKIQIISAVWCSSCLITNKHIKNLQKDFKNISIEKIDYDLDEDKVKELNIGTTLPVMIFRNENNEEISRLVGEKSYNEILEEIKKGE